MAEPLQSRSRAENGRRTSRQFVPSLHPASMSAIRSASSGGRCNTCAQFTRWSFESQCLSGSLIQAQRDMVELRLRKTRQVGASREVLPQEQIGVFIAAALPGTLWIAEVDLHIRGYRKLLVLGHLQTAIPGQRTF